MNRSWIVILLCYLPQKVSCSVGDSSWLYRLCTDNCRQNYLCPARFDSCAWSSGPCFRCRYDCMWKAVDEFVVQRGFVPQFHGKWPFLSVDFSLYGLLDITIQEPASFIFSLLNFYSFLVFYKRVKVMNRIENNRAWIIYSLVGLVTWSFSAVFHARDCWFTEYLDYFSAFAFVLCASYVSLCLTQSCLCLSTNRAWWTSSVYGIILFLWFTRHVYYMTQHFDYGYNMRCCIGVSLLTTAMYLMYIARRWRQSRRLSRSDCMLLGIILWTNGSVLLETLDFAPLFWLFDAHSLFHAATVPLPSYLYTFLNQRLKEESMHGKNV